MTWTVDEGDVAVKKELALAASVLAILVVSSFGSLRAVAVGSRAGGALEKFSVGVTKFNCNVTELFSVMF